MNQKNKTKNSKIWSYKRKCMKCGKYVDLRGCYYVEGKPGGKEFKYYHFKCRPIGNYG